MLLPSSRTSRTAPALNSAVNARRARRPFRASSSFMRDIVSTFHQVSTKSGQAQEAFLAIEMAGSSRSEERRLGRAAIDFALEAVRVADSAKHDRSADRRLALYCAESTLLVVRLMEIAAGKRDPA